MIESSNRSNIKFAALYFLLSTIITWWFIEVSPLYTSTGQKLLSCAIAGAKWNIQMLAAVIFLQEKKWIFLKNIGFTCLLGSVILLPYSIGSFISKDNDGSFFIISLIVSVAAMVFSYYRSVKKSDVGTHWFAGWLLCLAIAITLQLKVIFNLNLFQG